MIITCMKCGTDDRPPNFVWKRNFFYIFNLKMKPIVAWNHCRDILKLREMVRKNFLMYYAQENLFDLKARQMAENRLMDEVEFFAMVCAGFSNLSADRVNKISSRFRLHRNAINCSTAGVAKPITKCSRKMKRSISFRCRTKNWQIWTLTWTTNATNYRRKFYWMKIVGISC